LDYDPKHVLPHGGYLINLGNPDRYVVRSTLSTLAHYDPLSDFGTPTDTHSCFRNDSEKRMKSYECFLDDLKKCEGLRLKYYNFQ
jgi:AP endonuclease-1